MNTQVIRFLRRGQPVSLAVDTNRTLLDLLREDLHCTGTKEGCGEGDCGACTVVVGEEKNGKLELQAINSCIRMAHSVDGLALWTVEDLQAADGTLHPAQQAMLQCHGSQCGFCTPGFVMSLFGLYEKHGAAPVSRSQAQAALSGNLCRCTGYRPILEAAQTMHQLPTTLVDKTKVLAALRQMARTAPQPADPTSPTLSPSNTPSHTHYHRPQKLAELLALRSQYPDAQLVAGCTDVGLWVTKQHREFARVIDTTRVRELRQIEDSPHHIAIGAAVTLTDAFAALAALRPQLQGFAERFAGLPVRNSGTLGGNVANGSPIGDSMPLLIALGAHVVLMSQRGHREMRLEAIYTGYRKNVMAADEVLAWIKVPKPGKQEFMRAYKVSKRWEDDISAVCLAIQLQLHDGRVRQASIGVGGVAATPVRAQKTQIALQGRAWNAATVQHAMQVLRSEFSPISDMRASASYRSEVLGNLLQRFWLESQGRSAASLDSLPATLQGEAA